MKRGQASIGQEAKLKRPAREAKKATRRHDADDAAEATKAPTKGFHVVLASDTDSSGDSEQSDFADMVVDPAKKPGAASHGPPPAAATPEAQAPAPIPGASAGSVGATPGHEGASVVETEVSSHKPWWLTRTGRKATCASCGLEIPGQQCRLLCEPNPAGIKDKRVWSSVWWKYYHIDSKCVAKCEVQLKSAEDLCVDVKPLPKSKKESKEAYEASVAASKALALEQLAACGLYRA